jgi:hypothetical protein
LKLSGSAVVAVHGPLTSVAFSHARSFRRKYVFVGSYENRSQLVFTANFSSLFAIGLQIGSPSRFRRIAGRVL